MRTALILCGLLAYATLVWVVVLAMCNGNHLENRHDRHQPR